MATESTSCENTSSGSLDSVLTRLAVDMQSIQFQDIISAIDDNYDYTPSRFINGIGDDRLVNEAGTNEGSCKIFSFGRLHKLSEQQTLNCFGDYYRIDVLQNPQATDHSNIRSFMRHGWDGISFEPDALKVNNPNQ